MIETEFAARLAAASALTDLVQERISPGRMPPKTLLPYVVWARTDTEPDDTFDTDKAAPVAAFEVDCFGSTYAQAKLVAAQVAAACDGWEGVPPAAIMSASIGGEFYDYDTEAAAHRVTLSIPVLYRK